VDFVEICNIYVRKVIIKAAKKIFNSDKICRSYSNLNFGVTFFGTQCITAIIRVLYVYNIAEKITMQCTSIKHSAPSEF